VGAIFRPLLPPADTWNLIPSDGNLFVESVAVVPISGNRDRDGS
jgi:hypothetical protein